MTIAILCFMESSWLRGTDVCQSSLQLDRGPIADAHARKGHGPAPPRYAALTGAAPDRELRSGDKAPRLLVRVAVGVSERFRTVARQGLKSVDAAADLVL